MKHIHIKAFPASPQEHVEETKPGHLRIFVREPAKDNAANKRILFLTAHHYQIPINTIRMIKGHRGNSKIIEVLEK